MKLGKNMFKLVFFLVNNIRACKTYNDLQNCINMIYRRLDELRDSPDYREMVSFIKKELHKKQKKIAHESITKSNYQGDGR